MNSAALILIVIASLGKTPEKIGHRDFMTIVNSVGVKTCSADNGKCVAAVVTEAVKAVKADRKSQRNAELASSSEGWRFQIVSTRHSIRREPSWINIRTKCKFSINGLKTKRRNGLLFAGMPIRVLVSITPEALASGLDILLEPFTTIPSPPCQCTLMGNLWHE